MDKFKVGDRVILVRAIHGIDKNEEGKEFTITCVHGEEYVEQYDDLDLYIDDKLETCYSIGGIYGGWWAPESILGEVCKIDLEELKQLI